MPGENEDPLNLPSEEAALERFKKIRAELEAMDLPDLPEDEVERRTQAVANIPSGLPEVPKLEDIRANAWAAKEKHDSTKAETERKQAQDQKNARGLGVGLMVAYLIMGFPFLGIGIGWVLDAQLNANVYKGLGALIGSTVGVTVSIIYINNSNKGK